MAKERKTALNVKEIGKQLKQNKLLPVYFIYGEDAFAARSAMKAIEKFLEPSLTSDFDRETISLRETPISDVLLFASAFPFGSGKKLIIAKDFEFRGKKEEIERLIEYIQSPSDFTVLIIIKEYKEREKISLDSKPYNLLHEKGYLFEAKAPKDAEIIEWIKDFSEERNKIIEDSEARLIVEIAGSNKSFIETQLEKIFEYLGEKERVDLDSIKQLTTNLKKRTIFELQNAFGVKNKKEALEIAYNLLGSGESVLFIITMLTKYFSALAQMPEFEKDKTTADKIAPFIGSHPGYVQSYFIASKKYSPIELKNAFIALLNADFSVKTSFSDPKTIITVLISEILKS